MSTLKTQRTRNYFKSLKKIEDLFNGTLGVWNDVPVDLELKDDAKPVCSRPYSVPRLHEAMFRK